MEKTMRFDDKHEPKGFNELIFADQTARNTCARYVNSAPHKSLLLWGEPGTAKTTTARVIVKERLRTRGYNDDIEELNGAGFKMEKMERKLLNIASLQRTMAGEAFIIINEFDEIERDERAKFRAFMDKHKSMCFVATTNEQPSTFGAKQKLMPALLSRFELVELKRPSVEDCLARAQDIFMLEGHTVSQANLRVLLANFGGDIRDLLPIVEQAVDELNAASAGAAAAQLPKTPSHLKVIGGSGGTTAKSGGEV
jgi:replication-associated recombination protein RarA